MSVDAPTRDEPPAPEDPRATRGRWRTVTFVVVPLVAFTLLLASGLGKDPRALPSTLVGKPAPEFSLAEMGTRRTVSLFDLRGQVVIVNFWASWCAACREEHPALLVAWQRYRERGVVLLGVLFEDTEAGARAYMAELGGDWPILLDPGSATALDYGVYGIPETFIIAPDGTIAYKRVGPVTYGWLVDKVDAALHLGRPPRDHAPYRRVARPRRGRVVPRAARRPDGDRPCLRQADPKMTEHWTDNEGTRYYFCSSGCLQREDPR